MARDVARDLDDIFLGSAAKYTSEQIICASGVPEELARAMWRALGFPDSGGEAAFTDADLEALRTVHALMADGLLDEETAVVIARSLGQTTSRLAEWQTDALGRFYVHREGLVGRDLASEPEVLARVLARTEALVGPLQQLLAYAWRRQLTAVMDRTLAQGEAAAEPAGAGTVGFADLVGFTHLSRHLENADLAALVERFESVSADVVTAAGAMLVKTVGDEVFFVAPDASTGAEAAMRLHEAHAADPDVPQMRIGLATGPLLRRMGDVFGSTVNLASRLTALAHPDTTVVDAATAAALADQPGIRLRQMAPRRLRGIGVMRMFQLERGGA